MALSAPQPETLSQFFGHPRTLCNEAISYQENMAISISISMLSLTFPSKTLTKTACRCNWTTSQSHATPIPKSSTTNSNEQQTHCSNRRSLVLGLGSLTAAYSSPARPLLAAEGLQPENYESFVDKIDGYSYYYPSDWREFDFRGHDSAFKDRFLQLQNVRLSFIPTDKTDIHELGPMDDVVSNLVTNVYSAPNQVADVMDMQEKNVDGRNYCTFEYTLTSPNFARSAFATIAIGNGRYYTLIVGANDRRWRRVRNKLKVVADSFKVLDI